MASGSTNPTIEEIKKLLEQNKYSSKDISELRRDIAEASAVLSRYTTVKGKLFGELQEDKARLNSLKDELDNAEKEFDTAKKNLEQTLSNFDLSGLIDKNFNKTIDNAIEKTKELEQQIKNFAEGLPESELESFNNALNNALKGDFDSLNKNYSSITDIVKEKLELENDVTVALQSQNKEIRKAVNVESQAMRMRKQGWSDIRRGATEAFRIGKDFLDVWGKIDQAASKFAKTIGTSAVGMERLRKNAIESVQKGRFGAKYNVSADELIGLQESYSNTIGRNIQISASDQENMAAMFRVMGEGGGDFAAKLENFGLSYTDAANKAGKMFKEASKYGISFDKYSKNVANNIKLAQNYTFKNGIKGLESMAKKATAMKLDMQQVASFADKVSTVEGAIGTGAQLQVLGGPFAQFSDPMGMMNEALTDMEGLQDRFEKMIGGLGRFDEQKGEIAISAFDKQRIKVAAEAMGMSYDQVMETTMAKGRQKFIGGQIANKGYTEDEQELLKNIATVQNGKATVSYVDSSGKKQEVNLAEKSLSKTELEMIKQQTQSESDDIKDIATTLRGWDDVMQGTKKQYENTKAAVIERRGWGVKAKNIVEHVAESNRLLGLILAAVTTLGLGNAALSMLRGGGSLIGGRSGGAGRRVLARSGIESSGFWGRTGSNIVSKGVGVHELGKKTLAKTTTGFGRAVGKTQVGIGKAIGGIGKNVAKFGKAASGVGLLGAGISLGTDALVSSGKMKKGGFGDFAGHIGGDALSFGATGLALGGPIGAAIGAALGTATGIVKGVKNKKEQNILEKHNVEIQGSYGLGKLNKINKALETGKIDDKLREKLQKNGDYELLSKIDSIKEQRANIDTQNVEATNVTINTGNSASRSGQSFANGGMLHGPSHAQGGMPILGSNIEVEGGEFVVNKKSAKKYQNALNAINSMGNGGVINNTKNTFNSTNMYSNGGIIKPRKMENGGSVIINQTGGNIGGQSFGVDKITVDPINVNVSGSIKLEGANGQKAELTADLLKNPQFISEITKLITRQMNINIHGANVINRPDA